MVVLTIDLHGTQWSVECSPADTVAALKQKVSAVADVPVANVLGLIFEGQRLEDESRTLASYDLTGNARVYLVLRQRPEGGAASFVRAENAHRAARHGGLRS